jgi:hypothetical protein
MRELTLSKKLLLLGIIGLPLFILAIISYFYPPKTENIPQKTQIAPPIVRQKPITIIVPPTIIPPPSMTETFTALFGVSMTTEIADQRSSLWFEQSFIHHDTRFHAVFIKTQLLDTKTKTLIDSHADGVILNVVVYQQVGRQWQLFAQQKNIGVWGEWGDVLETKQVPLLVLSDNVLAFLFEGGATGQGFSETGMGLFSFNFKDKAWKNVGFIKTGGDNSGACDDSPQSEDSMIPCWQYTGEITVTKIGENPDYPNLIVHHKGTTAGFDNKVIPMRNRVYFFNGEQYVKQN